MREILFRGKRADGKGWAEGCLIHTPKYCCILQDEEKVHPMDYPYLDGDTGCIDGYTTPVLPATIGQFTGSTDKNGKKIFEGDIISIMFETDGVDGFPGYSWYETAAVVFSEEKHAWIAVFDECGEEIYLNEYDDMDEVYVIGNIYDEPEAMEDL